MSIPLLQRTTDGFEYGDIWKHKAAVLILAVFSLSADFSKYNNRKTVQSAQTADTKLLPPRSACVQSSWRRCSRRWRWRWAWVRAAGRQAASSGPCPACRFSSSASPWSACWGFPPAYWAVRLYALRTGHTQQTTWVTACSFKETSNKRQLTSNVSRSVLSFNIIKQ